MSQLRLFPDPKPDHRSPVECVLGKAKGEERKVVQALRSAKTGGLVNGMSKAALRRYAPAKLPKVTT